MKKTSVICLLILLMAIGLAAETILVDFNNTSDLNTYFHNPNPGDVINSSSGGIGNSGAVQLPYLFMGDTRIMTFQTGFHLNQIDEPVIVSAYFNSAQNGGWAGIGLSSSSTNTSGMRCHITNVPAVGMQFYSSGYSFFNNTTASDGSYIPDIALSWYKLVYTIIPRGGDLYDANYELYQCNSSGVIGPTPTKSHSQSFTNTTIDDGIVYPYFGHDGHRLTYVDDFSVTFPDDATLPVTLSSFTATVSSQALISLQWITESESNILGFNIYRSENPNLVNAIKLNASFIEGTNTSNQHTYRFYDNEFEPNTTYYYWLESAEIGNSSSFFGPISVVTGSDEEVIPPSETVGVSGIVEVYPNPFGPNTDIAYKLNDTADVMIDIYNLKGQLIRSLVNGTKAGGTHHIGWDGRDNNGNRCSGGLYYARMQAGGINSLYKLTLVK